MITLLRYQSEGGDEPITQWLRSLRDAQARARIEVRLTRLALGNFGDCKTLRSGVSELRIDWGPGYRVYYGMVGKTVVLLLSGGDKRKQDADIEQAIRYFEAFKRRQL